MSMWIILAVVCAAGAVGGIVNALLSNDGVHLPGKYRVDGEEVLKLGVIGNILLGAIAAGVSWGLYGEYSNSPIIGSLSSTSPSLTIAALVGAVLVGTGGARVFTNELDKGVLRRAASHAAAAAADSSAAQRIMEASPADALKIASEMSTLSKALEPASRQVLNKGTSD